MTQLLNAQWASGPSTATTPWLLRGGAQGYRVHSRAHSAAELREASHSNLDHVMDHGGVGVRDHLDHTGRRADKLRRLCAIAGLCE